MQNDKDYIPFDLIQEEIDGTISIDGTRQLAAWKTANPENLKKYSEVISLQDQLILLDVRKNTDPELAWNKFKPQAIGAKAKVRKMFTYYAWRGVAALLLIFLLFAIPSLLGGTVTIKTAKNERRKIILPDGSQATMNGLSEMSYDKRTYLQNRKIKMITGEVFFDVKHIKQTPFSIQAHEISVKDIGTRFNLKVEADNISVVVSSGVVAFGKFQSNDGTLLSADYQGNYNRRTKQLSSGKNTDANYKAWYDEEFRFVNSSLEQVAADMFRALGTKIIFQESELHNRRLTAFFKHKSESQMIEIIAATLQIHFRKKGNTFIFYK